MSNAILGYGSVFAIHDGSSTFDAIAEVIEISPPNQQADDVDVTHMASPGQTREFIQGLIDPGEMSITINWVPSDATDVIIQALKTSGATRQMRITWPNNVKWTFSGFIKGFEPSSPIDDRMTATITVRVSGNTTIS